MEKARELLKIVGQANTVEVLEYLCEHGTAQHLDLNAFTNTHTLNVRLRQLIKHGLIEHNYERHIPKKNGILLQKRVKRY